MLSPSPVGKEWPLKEGGLRVRLDTVGRHRTPKGKVKEGTPLSSGGQGRDVLFSGFESVYECVCVCTRAYIRVCEYVSVRLCVHTCVPVTRKRGRGCHDRESLKNDDRRPQNFKKEHRSGHVHFVHTFQ